MNQSLAKRMMRSDEMLISSVEPVNEFLVGKRRKLSSSAPIAVLTSQYQIPRAVEIDWKASSHQGEREEVINIGGEL
jgi:hypothetical protein